MCKWFQSTLQGDVQWYGRTKSLVPGEICPWHSSLHFRAPCLWPESGESFTLWWLSMTKSGPLAFSNTQIPCSWALVSLEKSCRIQEMQKSDVKAPLPWLLHGRQCKGELEDMKSGKGLSHLFKKGPGPGVVMRFLVAAVPHDRSPNTGSKCAWPTQKQRVFMSHWQSHVVKLLNERGGNLWILRSRVTHISTEPVLKHDTGRKAWRLYWASLMNYRKKRSAAICFLSLATFVCDLTSSRRLMSKELTVPAPLELLLRLLWTEDWGPKSSCSSQLLAWSILSSTKLSCPQVTKWFRQKSAA